MRTAIVILVVLAATLAGAIVENRTLEEIYQAALKEGGVVTCWHGGDAKDDSLKIAFEKRFPNMTLNLTIDVSKYHDGNVDLQIAAGHVYVDSVILQTLHDFPRWKQQGALLNYYPLGLDSVYSQFKDGQGFYNGVYVYYWSNLYNKNNLKGHPAPVEYTDYLAPFFKNNLVLTYPNDDDAVLYQFYLIVQKYGWGWFDALVKQNPTWVRGTQKPATLLSMSNFTYTASFTTSGGFAPSSPIGMSFPKKSDFVSWPQLAAILKNSPHPEGAKLFHSWLLSKEFQQSPQVLAYSWSVREDVSVPGYPDVFHQPATDVSGFMPFMMDRAAVERLRFLFEYKIGTAQGVNPLLDPINQ